ncbi:AsmA-like C-terminal region-containing protein [Algoriphagus boritolerans]|uniref:AsmA-like C-terminal region n=1 Tax=Algoriphagus boritolerans DSM 17298 = JCM 18970 TaxID=1120964 RepID=A0A1H5RWH9_9BACT|nr:AsmA-like C-terminal region-containing protein [Algoriphagus boritolerans]SEF42590.1 AsmA-like C-terminal region [Algoriphagus boritolerans DSM 17298 = JCM 18970]
MKKFIVIFLGILVLLLGTAVAIPFLFKDKIIARVNQELDQAFNAKIFYDPDQISLSLFRNFPAVSAGLGDFGIVGLEPFENDTLVHADELSLDFNLRSILFDDYPTLTGLHLNGGDLYLKVLEDGRANYDITKESTSTEPEVASNFKLGVDMIEINNVNLIYDDRSLKFVMALAEIEAKGSGEFTMDVYDLPLQLKATIVDLNYDGVHYLSNKKFRGETLLQVDLEQMKFTLAESKFGINEFLFDLNGIIGLPEEGIALDLTFGTEQTDFKNILSLVPGIYTESFSSINTTGTLSFGGFVKGLYGEDTYPAFDVNLEVKDGMFQYPDLPLPVKDINLSFQAKNESSQIENTSVTLPIFSMNVGSNPLSGDFKLANLRDYDLEGKLNGRLNLKELTAVFPIEKTQLAGILDFNASAKGRYDSTLKVLPSMDIRLNLENGFIQNTDYPVPLERLHAKATILNQKGTMQDFLMDISSFGFDLEGEKIEGNLKISDFEALNWNGAVNGGVDLKKLTAIFPIADTQLEGLIKADLQSSGSYADVEKERYDRLQASGTMDIRDLFFSSTEYPQGVRILEAHGDFNPQRANLTQFRSQLGKSPLEATGFLSNYMDYLLSDKGVLKGQLALKSTRFDVNEWMSSSDASTDSTELEVIPLPENIDFSMSMVADEVIYENLNLKEVSGNMILRNGVLSFSETGMKTLDGRIKLNGNYDPRNLAAPLFDFTMDISELSIAKAFQSLETVKAFAPIASEITGKVSTNISFSGLLSQNMMPVLSSIDVQGILKVAEAALKDSKILSEITSLTRLKDANLIQLRNLSIPIVIEDGRIEVKPFDLKLWDYETNIQGTAGFDGSINYLLNMQVPAGQFGAQANSILSTLSGTETNASTLIPLAINLSGTYNQPKISLAGGNSIETLLTNALKSRFDSEKQNLQAKATEEFQAAQDSIKQEIKLKAELAQDSVKKELEKKVNQSAGKAVDEAKTLLKGLILKPKAKPDTTKVNN